MARIDGKRGWPLQVRLEPVELRSVERLSSSAIAAANTIASMTIPSRRWYPFPRSILEDDHSTTTGR
jgi:hypothetical protein